MTWNPCESGWKIWRAMISMCQSYRTYRCQCVTACMLGSQKQLGAAHTHTLFTFTFTRTQGKVGKGVATTCRPEYSSLQKALVHRKKDHTSCWDDAVATQWAARGWCASLGCGCPLAYGRERHHIYAIYITYMPYISHICHTYQYMPSISHICHLYHIHAIYITYVPYVSHTCIIGVSKLTEMQKEQVHLPHRHRGMGLRLFNGDVGTAARLSSAALAHAALTDGNERALPFRGMAEEEARGSLSKLREAWPSINGLSNSPDEPVEWARLPPDGKMLRMAAMQQAVSRADADARVAALFSTLEADARRPAARPKDQALWGMPDLSRLRSCSGALA